MPSREPLHFSPVSAIALPLVCVFKAAVASSCCPGRQTCRAALSLLQAPCH